jgi:hypothetical protein
MLVKELADFGKEPDLKEWWSNKMKKSYDICMLNKCLFCRALPLLVTALILAGCSGHGGGTGSSAPERKWTYMVYMAADTDISAAAEHDINEMETIGSSNDVNIVVQVEFNPMFSPDYSSSTLRGRIINDIDIDPSYDVINSPLTYIGNQNMTDPQTLTGFIDWAATYYPAQRYALVLWSHGSGWKAPYSSVVTKGMIKDETSAGGSYIMPLQDIADAIQESSVELDIINLDTCLMGMYEVAYEFRGLTDYITFSEERYPIFGDPYDDILWDLTHYPDMDARVLAQVITSECRTFYQYLYEALEYEVRVTKSALDMSHIDQLHSGLCALAEVMSDNMDSEGPNIQDARGGSLSYYFPEHHDLGHFLEKLSVNSGNVDIDSAIATVEGALSDLVLSNEVFSYDPNDEIYSSRGIAIYLPGSNGDLDDYSELSCNQSGSFTWVDFLEDLLLFEENG